MSVWKLMTLYKNKKANIIINKCKMSCKMKWCRQPTIQCFLILWKDEKCLLFPADLSAEHFLARQPSIQHETFSSTIPAHQLWTVSKCNEKYSFKHNKFFWQSQKSSGGRSLTCPETYPCTRIGTGIQIYIHLLYHLMWLLLFLLSSCASQFNIKHLFYPSAAVPKDDCM